MREFGLGIQNDNGFSISTVEKIVAEEVQNAVNLIKANIQRNGKVVTGRLYNSIEGQTTNDGSKIEGIIFAEDYIRPQQHDWKSQSFKQPPSAPILEWINNRNLFADKKEWQKKSIAYAIARHIGGFGYNPNYRADDLYEGPIEQAWANIERRVGQLDPTVYIVSYLSSLDLDNNFKVSNRI